MIFEDFLNLFWMLPAVALLVYVYLKRKPHGHLRFSSVRNVKRLTPSLKLRLRALLPLLYVIAVILIVIALARPQKGVEETRIETEGVDIVLAVDVSGSMMAEDFIKNGKRRNRLTAVKEVMRDFIKKRTNDRIGLVVFAGRAYVQCPLTLDYGVLLQFLDRLEIGMIEDGTAVGDGIAMSLSRLRKIESKSKVVVLLTDGVSNAGQVDPENAAELAKATGIKIYTIGAGSRGKVPFPAQDFFGNKVYQWAVIDIDEKSLQKIAAITNGRYFRAYDMASLAGVYEEIDRLEKTKAEIDAYMEYNEWFPPLVLAALILILLEAVLRNTWLRTLP